MSDILAEARTYLLSQTGVTDVASTRIYFDNLPQSATLPAVVLELNDDYPAARHLGGTGDLKRTSMTAYSYATTRTVAATLGDAVYSALEFDTGTWGATTVDRSLVENTFDATDQPKDGSGAWRHIRAVFFAVWHR